jgi:pimeloyl-ACP methyl ester carboxylesterase
MEGTTQDAPQSAADWATLAAGSWDEFDFAPYEHNLQIEGRSVKYVDLGDPGLPVLFYVHGLMGTWRNWIFNLLPFADRYRVIAIDLPGFGESQLPARGISIEHYAETLKEFATALGIGRFTLVGNSMGGHIGAMVAKRTPELLERLVLVDPAGFSTSTRFLGRLSALAWTINWFFLLAARFRRTIAFNRRLAAVLTKIVLHKPKQISSQLILMLLEGVGKAGFVPAIRAIATTPIAPVPGEVTVRTAIIWGRNDLLVPRSDAFRYANLIPHARLELMDDVGHIPMFETPERFNAVLEDFLASAATPAQAAAA